MQDKTHKIIFLSLKQKMLKFLVISVPRMFLFQNLVNDFISDFLRKFDI